MGGWSERRWRWVVGGVVSGGGWVVWGGVSGGGGLWGV